MERGLGRWPGRSACSQLRRVRRIEPRGLAQSSDENPPPHGSPGAEKDSRKMFFAAALGTFVGRIAGDEATDARREWLPKLWDWFN